MWAMRLEGCHHYEQKPNAPGRCRLLRARREGPRGRCAADERDELAPSHVGPPPPESAYRTSACHRVAGESYGRA